MNNSRIIKIEVQKQLTKAKCEIRSIERGRDVSLWSQANNNEKIRLSNLTTRAPTRSPTPEFSSRMKVVHLHQRKQAFYKRHPVVLPKPPPEKRSGLTIRHVLRFREREERPASILVETSQTERPSTQQEPVRIPLKQLVKKQVIAKKEDEFQEMMDLYQSRKMRAVASDVSVRRQKIDFGKLKQELKRTLRYIGRLGLTIAEGFSQEVFSVRPFQKAKSYQFIQAAKYGDMYQLKDLLQENKYLVYDFDYVFECAKLDLHDGAALGLQARTLRRGEVFSGAGCRRGVPRHNRPASTVLRCDGWEGRHCEVHLGPQGESVVDVEREL